LLITPFFKIASAPKNPAFELVKKKYITGILSEFGNLSYNQFLKKVKKRKFS